MRWFHADHGVPHEWVAAQVCERDGFFIEVLLLPDEYPDVLCALYGPSEGDEPLSEDDVRYECRNGRPCASRLVARPQRPARHVVVIGMGTDDTLLIFTAYGSIKGVAARQEPGDPSIADWETLVSCREFWAEHALAVEPSEVEEARV